MRSIWKLLLVYTLIMLAVLGIMILVWNNTEFTAGDVGSYSSEEFGTYKKVWENLNVSVKQEQDRMRIVLIVFWSAVFVIGYVFIILVYMIKIKPVKELEGFAAEIAKGNLDIKLPIRSHTPFGTFTESFDLMRDEIKASRKREMDAEKAKREMVAELSHDLKTPVATIRATCEVLDLKLKKLLENTNDDPLKAEIEGYIEKTGYIHNKAELIERLVGNMFRATLDDMDEIEIKPEETDSRIIEDYFVNLKEYGKIILDNNITQCLVYIDRLRMEQVIDNVVGNSYKYAGTDIHVTFGEIDAPAEDGKLLNRFLRITVKDTGPGVDEEELPLITEKFRRGRNAKEKQGYGLGLYLVKRYMEKQGGGMEYYNDNGFVVELLVKKV